MTSCVPSEREGIEDGLRENFQNEKPQALGEGLLDFKKACRGNIYDFLEVYLPLDTTNPQLIKPW